MQMFHATVEVDAPAFTRHDSELVHQLAEQLEQYHGVPFSSPRGFRGLSVTYPAETVVQAAHTAAMIASAHLGKDPIVLEVMTEDEFDAREGFGDIPELASVTQVAEDLGVSRAAVLDRIRRGTLEAIKVGDTYAIPRRRER